MKNSFLFLIGLLLVTSTFAQPLDSIFKNVKYRNIGPFRGGRADAGSGVVGDPLTYYMGTTGGGLWKTENAGQLWKNVSDGYFKTASVGAVAVSESNPNIVYCGMGEHPPRGVMTSYGDGVYKSSDAGKTWTHLGLEATQSISRIVIHPDNPDIVYVAAQGALNGPTNERGIYKSTDGGVTWKNVLFVNNLTGCSELSMDMSNPRVLYAAMWEHQRKPWIVISGGAGSGLYKSSDAGETWTKMESGLPKEMGKMAIAVCRSNPDRVYALIESDSKKEKGGLFVSNDSGDSWNKVSGDHRLVQRAWYYIEVFPDPQDENSVYVMSAQALRSIDGGKTWQRITGTHGDFHDLWINPNDNTNMIISNDGGSAVSFNSGKTWSSEDHMPTAQFYRVNADNLFPYNLYGGQQDNSSVRIPSLSQGRRSITAQDWTYSAGGESAFLAFDPDNPRYVMGGSYLGTIEVLDQEVKASTEIMAAPIQYLGRAASDMKYRFDWNAPIIRSSHDPNTYYHGAQYLLRTRDMGKTWEEVSPDLTRNDKAKQMKGGGPYTVEAVGAENYGCLSYVIESPSEAGVIYTGSNDGVVQITRDNGKTWTDITPKGLPETLVNSIEVSPHNPAVVYIATTRYKFNDHTPAIYKSINYGKTWTNISSGIPAGAYTRVVREDPVRKDLLFAGTETGLYISWNGGKKWSPFQLNLPVTPITDLMIHKGDLLVATAGRSFWILDDLGLLRQYKTGDPDFNLYQPENAIIGNWGSPLNGSSSSFSGSNSFSGVNPANGVVMYYSLPKLDSSAVVTMDIKSSDGKVIRQISSEKNKNYKKYDGGPPPAPVLSRHVGINRFVWDMRYPIMEGVPNVYIEASFRGHKTPPGHYEVTLKSGTRESTREVDILPNPTYQVSAETYAEYDGFMSRMEENLSAMHKMVNSMYRMRHRLEEVLKETPKETRYEQVRTNGTALVKRMKLWDLDMIQRKSKAYDDVENFPNKFTAEYLFLINRTASSLPRVNQSSKDRFKELSAQWEVLKARGDKIINEDVPAMNKQLWDAGLGVVR